MKEDNKSSADVGVIEELTALFEPWNRSDMPGLVVGVNVHGRPLYRGAYGMQSLESAVANSTATRMRIGSTSKHFACLLLLLLAEDGKLDLDKQIRTYIPELKGPGGDPTLRQLMQHRGGSRCYVDLGFLTGGLKPRPVGFALETQIRQAGRNFPPGQAMIYNNGGYNLLSIAAERVTGKSFGSLLAERLFGPLKMRSTELVLSDYSITPGIATMHTALPDGRWQRGLFPSEEIKGEGGIVSTVDDMLIWARHLSQRDVFGSKESWNELFTPHPSEYPEFGTYGLGVRMFTYRGVRAFGHTGGVIGGSCDLLCMPDVGLDINLLVNGAPGVTAELTRRVVDIVLAERIGPPDPVLQATDHKPWLGHWWSARTGMVYSLVDDEGILKLQICTQPFELALMPTPDGAVVLPEASLGETVFHVEDLQNRDVLRIDFGGATDSYTRLTDSAIEQRRFAAKVAGVYFCEDATATAEMSRTDAGLKIVIRDGWGYTEGPVSPLGADVASMGPLSQTYWCAITLRRTGEDVSGFVLNSARTRNLEFKRVN